MALIKFGMMMTDARGKLGGQVFTKTRSGATVRTKVTPANPQTTAQQAARSILGSLSSAWRGLEESDRLSWNAAVNDYSRTNIFGDSYLPSGKNLFVSLNGNLLNVGKTQLESAPTPAGVPSLLLTSATVDTNAEEIALSYTGSEPGVGFSKVIMATKPFSAGRYNFSGSYVKVASWDGTAEPLPAALYDFYRDKFGVPSTGYKIAFKVFVVNNATGEKSPESGAVAIVTSI